MGRHEVEGFNLRPLDAHQPSSKSCGDRATTLGSSSQSFYGREFGQRSRDREWMRSDVSQCNFRLLCNVGNEGDNDPVKLVNLDLIHCRFEVTEEGFTYFGAEL